MTKFSTPFEQSAAQVRLGEIFHHHIGPSPQYQQHQHQHHHQQQPQHDSQITVKAESDVDTDAESNTGARAGARFGVSATTVTPALAVFSGFHPQIELSLPALYHAQSGHGLTTVKSVTRETLNDYLSAELDVSRLNKLHKHLWAAGLPRPPRPLHEQIEIGRTIIVTERTDMHLLWSGSAIFLKPLPDFLLCYEIWEEHLCRSTERYSNALGLLYSYAMMICQPSDHRIAIEQGLLHRKVSWLSWSHLVRSLLDKEHPSTLTLTTVAAIPKSTDHYESQHYSVSNGASSVTSDAALSRIQSLVNPRYQFGELRLGRVNWIHRLCSKNRYTLKTLIRGYSYSYRDYSSLISDNLKFLLTIFLYVTMVLTAMQVGLATEYLNTNDAFQGASWVFSLLAILVPVLFVVPVLSYALFLVVWNLLFTKGKRGAPGKQHQCWEHAELAIYRH